MYDFSPACRVGPSFHMCLLAICKVFLLREAHVENHPQDGVMCGEAYRVWGWPWLLEGIPSGSIASFPMHPIPVRLVGCTSLRFPPTALPATSQTLHPQPHNIPQRSEWDEKWISLAVSPIAEETTPSFTCSYFPQWEESQVTGYKNHSFGNELCCLGGGRTQVKWKWSSYLLQCIQSWIFLLQQCAGTSGLNFWTSKKALSSAGDGQNWYSLRGKK